MPLDMSCIDTEGWDNFSGKRCSDYAMSEWCVRGAFKKGQEWTGGAQFNSPESNCCICGKTSAGAAGSGPYPWTSGATPPQQAVPLPQSPPAMTVETQRDVFGRPTPQSMAQPAVSEVVAEMERDVKAANDQDEAEMAQDERLHALIKQRSSSCAALTPNRAANFLLVSPRLPRVGNGVLCAILSACSQRPLPCTGTYDATMCPGGADWRYADLGPAKLHKEAYGCFERLSLPIGSSSGWDKLMGDCSSHGGDVSAMCSSMRSTALPAALSLQHEHFFELQAPPCSWEEAPVRHVTLLRDPGERAQSAFEFGLSACICAFKFQFCTMFTSFRFNTRRAALCDGAKPRFSFHEAVTVLRETGVREWPVATDNPQFVLGRYASAVIKNVYTPYFGAYEAPQSAEPGPYDPAPGSSLASSALARVTLAHCFAWVGIAEEMSISLQVLRHELPMYFRNINPDHPAFKWRPSSDRGERTGPANATHPFLRAHLLVDDYRLYDTERARLFSRATKLGLISKSASSFGRHV